MNTFGRLFRLSLYGESHGDEIGIIIDGCPAGLALSTSDFKQDLERRRAGASGTTGRRELDNPRVKSGLFEGKTTGTPVTISFANRDIRSAEYLPLRDTPRPGHADFVANQKYGGFNDFRGGGQFSGRLTVALVAAGVVAKKIIHPATVQAFLIEVGGTRDIENAVLSASAEGDSVGGVIECKLYVVGHTDNVGDLAYNMKLSQDRADSVSKVLVSKYGVDSARLTAQGVGPLVPVTSNKTEEGRTQNRRVELVEK